MDDLVTGRRRGTGGYRLPRRAGVGELEHDEGEDERRYEDEDDDPDPARSRLDALLRHGTAPITRSYSAVHAYDPGAGVLAWVERNRRWLIPWISALIVLVIEVLAGLFASRPIPIEGHAALGAFWALSVGRGTARVAQAASHEARLLEYARQRGIPLEEARGEWETFEASVAHGSLPGGHHGDD